MIRPLTLPAPDVLAILREIEAPSTGKTQFRRVLKVQPPHRDFEFTGFTGANLQGNWCAKLHSGNQYHSCLIPYAVGDLLWVRETWCLCGQMDDIPTNEMGKYEPVGYLADGNIREMSCSMISQGKTRPSPQMPRWASRITLRVTDVRVQRVQEISEVDAIAEGVTAIGASECPDEDYRSYVWAFNTLWNAAQGKPRKGKPDQSWDTNPWVTAVTFEPAMMNVNEVTK